MNRQSPGFRWLLSCILLIALAFGGVNVVAYNQAYAMLNFQPRAARTESPELLSPLEKANVLVRGVTIPKPILTETPSDHGLRYSTHRIETSDGLTLEGWYIPRAESRGSVILLHGYAGKKSSLLAEAEALHQMGFTTFLVDFRGSGGSEGTQTTVGYREAADVAATVATVRRLESGPLYVFGRSMGGVALLRALAHDGVEVDAIILEAVFDEMLNTVKNRFDVFGLPPFPAARLLIFWAGVQSGFSGFQHNPADYAASVDVPTLVIHGIHDTRVTQAQASHLYDRLGSADKQFVLFEQSGHADALVTSPAQWKRAVGQFLAVQ